MQRHNSFLYVSLLPAYISLIIKELFITLRKKDKQSEIFEQGPIPNWQCQQTIGSTPFIKWTKSILEETNAYLTIHVGWLVCFQSIRGYSYSVVFN